MKKASDLGITAVDILGPVMEAMSTITEADPKFELRTQASPR